MLDIKIIHENPEAIKENNKNRGVNVDVDLLLELDNQRKNLQQEFDQARNQQKKATNKEERSALKEQVKKLEEEFKKSTIAVTELLEQIPNLTHSESPIGKTDKDNKEVEIIGEIPKLKNPKDHLELAKKLDLIDFEAGAKIAGSRFYYLKNEAVLLEQALITYALNKLVAKGFIPMSTPDLARKEIIKASGFNPRDDSDQIYNIQGENLSLIGTSEIPIGAYHSGETLTNLPLKYVGISHCFRKEAGTYGAESRGLYRVHQFTKIEMYILCAPDKSEELHQELLAIEKEIYTELEIPFRVVDVCTGDLGGPAYRKYDLEAYMVMRDGWGEITSASNCLNYQARRLKIKYKDKTGKKKFVHTLNGTAIAMSRAPVAILENHQQPDGSINIPKILHPYLNFTKISKK